jgi:hypothetical protein
LEATISGAQAASAIEHKLRQFLKGKKAGHGSLAATLTKLHHWAISMESESETRLPVVTGRVSAGEACDVIEKQAAAFIGGAQGIERRLLSKSLQEVLFYCAAFNTDLGDAELQRKLRLTLRREGAASISQRFLAFFLFNFVWFWAGESFRSQAGTPAEFEADMQNTERFCQRIVADSWSSAEIPPGALNLMTARRVVRIIDERLGGSS